MQLPAVYRNGGCASRLRMPQHNMARCFLPLRHEACFFKCFDNRLRANAGQSRKHTYAIVAVLTVTPSETGSLLSASSGMGSLCAINVSR
jgi:hypothetical protein